MTIPNITRVVDAARLKEMQYDPKRGTYTYLKTWVSATNLLQRVQRAGVREGGQYFSLVSRRRVKSLQLHQDAVIREANLSRVIIRITVSLLVRFNGKRLTLLRH